jgi:hypothetical protein
MSKKNTKSNKYSLYKRYSFDRNAANAWNDIGYKTWLIADEGQKRHDPQRLTNFIFKYGMKNKKTGRSILSYIPEDYRKLIIEWVEMTNSEHKKVRKYSPDAGRKITNWLHQAEIMYWNELNNM